jgi:hypothetical protein
MFAERCPGLNIYLNRELTLVVHAINMKRMQEDFKIPYHQRNVLKQRQAVLKTSRPVLKGEYK